MERYYLGFLAWSFHDVTHAVRLDCLPGVRLSFHPSFYALFATQTRHPRMR